MTIINLDILLLSCGFFLNERLLLVVGGRCRFGGESALNVPIHFAQLLLLAIGHVLVGHHEMQRQWHHKAAQFVNHAAHSAPQWSGEFGRHVLARQFRFHLLKQMCVD